jgi:hypothetical protein
MLRSRAIVIRATGERDELVREARRLTNVVTNLPHVDERIADEAADEIGAAAREIDEIARLAGSLDGAAPPEERATGSRLRALGGEARARRRRLRAIRRRLLAEQSGFGDQLAA